jgi:hypothetical protein
MDNGKERLDQRADRLEFDNKFLTAHVNRFEKTTINITHSGINP